MRENVLARLYQYANKGETNAAKIFMDTTETLEQIPNIHNQLHNFIQIRGATITNGQIRFMHVAINNKSGCTEMEYLIF
jgi:hypothetical protein